MKSWFIFDKTLPTIDFAGPSGFRLPDALVKQVIGEFSGEGDWVLDPFAVCTYADGMCICSEFCFMLAEPLAWAT